MEAYMTEAYSSKYTGSSTSGFSGLPLELQDAIIGNLSPANVRNLQQTSRHFHERASRRIWRKLHFKLVPGATITVRSPQFRLVDALRTITTSSHNYAQYIHEFEVKVLDDGPSSSNHDMQVAARFLPDSDAQKLLSLSLYVLLRGATSLDRFRWHAPVELDSACWNQIAKSPSLRRLVVQLNARNPMFVGRNAETPTDLSYKSISGCSALSSLSVLEIDDLNHLDHIATCIRSSSGSLKSLKLTFSAALASKAKKSATAAPLPPPPPIDIQFDDGDDLSSGEEDIHITSSSSAGNPPNVDPELIKQHKTVQETALARLLSVHSEADTTMKSVERILQKASETKVSRTAGVDADTVKTIHDLIDKVMQGKKIEDSKVLDQLRDKLDNATVSRSAKRQKPSIVKKGKAKTTSAHHQNFAAPHGMPKSSNTSTTSNPWAGGPPAPVSLGGNYGYNYFEPPIPKPYSSTMPPLPFPTSSLQTSGHVMPNLPNVTDALFDQEVQNQEAIDEAMLFNSLGSMTGSTGKTTTSTYAILSKLLGGPPLIAADVDTFTMALNKKLDDLELTLTAIPPGPPPPALSTSKNKLKAALGKAKKLQAPIYDESLSDSSESESDEPTSASNTSIPDNSASDETKATSYDDMGIDMIHPEPVAGDSGDEQEILDDGDDTPRSLKDKGKGKEVVGRSTAGSGPPSRSASPTKRGCDVVDDELKELTPEQSMREWIRKKHGLALEELQLYLIPLKASVLGRALQLQCLKQVCLLSVGGQGPFWQLMCKVQEDTPLNLTDIFTDDVSAPFLQCVSQLQGVAKLVLRRRAKKAVDNTTSKDPASIDDIRRLAVQPHIQTLQMLAIENNQDQSWCLTQAFIWLLCAQGDKLRELAFQCGTHRMYEFTSRTERPWSEGALDEKAKFRLPSLVAFHYLGVGPSSTPHGAPVPSGPGANGEPQDPNHDAWARDSYKTCRELLNLWARHRRERGEAKLRYVGIGGAAVEIGQVKTVRKIPDWLQEDFDLQQEKGAQTGECQDIEQWIQENGYEHWVTTKHVDIKPKRIHECRAVIFGKAIRNAKL